MRVGVRHLTANAIHYIGHKLRWLLGTQLFVHVNGACVMMLVNGEGVCPAVHGQNDPTTRHGSAEASAPSSTEQVNDDDAH